MPGGRTAPDQRPGGINYKPPGERGRQSLQQTPFQEQQDSGPDPTLDDGGINPEFARENPDEAQARLTRRRHEMFEEDFKPFEDELLQRAQDRGLADEFAGRARRDIRDSFDATEGMRDRRLSRIGQSVSGTEQESLNRSRDLAETSRVVAAGNQARQQTQQAQEQLMTQLGNVGQGIDSQSAQDLSAAGGMARARDQAFKRRREQHQAQQKQNAISGAATGASLAMSASLGAPGIAASAVTGLGAALLGS